MSSPLSTYRLQFNQGFTFRDAANLVPYLHGLGVDWLYASPWLEARPGSPHGYDIVNHDRLNPEIGDEADQLALSRALGNHGMGQLVDIVPNHMGVGEVHNEWWADVLENGASSRFASFFDIDWEPLEPQLAGKVLLPILGDQFGRVLENGDLRLSFDLGRFTLHYHDHRLPVSPKSSTVILRDVAERMPDDDWRAELLSVVASLEHLADRDHPDEDSVAERRRENAVSRRRLAALCTVSQEFCDGMDAALADFNGRPGDPHSFDRLERILADQAYRLAFWRVAAHEINYRRFFDINELAGLRAERPEVFRATHALIFRMVAEGRIDGLRVDHPDGLYDPLRYLEGLRKECKTIYIVVEKILTGDEPLPEEWPVSGTVGYDFLNLVNGLFVDASAERAMHAIYQEFIGRAVSFERTAYLCKSLILRTGLVSELNVLAWLLDRISESNRRYRDFTLGSLQDALRETIASFPVYRTYIDAERGKVSDLDTLHVDGAIDAAIRRNRATSRSVFDFIRDILLLQWPDDLDAEARDQHARFVMKFQQLTGPVMAKGVEDTAFYVFNRLVSLNEVGGDPNRFGVPPEAFHAAMERRARHWPRALNTTTTHDTKRSEDVRARIDVLSEMPDEWRAAVQRWSEMHRSLKATSEDGDSIPTANDEYLLYQTLVGAWPLEPPDGEFVTRMQRYMEKATREAKMYTSWVNPNESYDAAMRDFVAGVLSDEAFLADFLPFQERIAHAGMLNSLSQAVLRLTCPGVPDLYQGQELWDFSLVDPDNRQPVDYARRQSMLERMPRDAPEMMERWREGWPKLHVVRTLLHFRRREPDLFREGSYVPSRAEGPLADRLIAFRRQHRDRAVLVVAPRLTLDRADWGQTAIAAPAGMEGPWVGLLSGRRIEGDRLRAGEILADFPVEVLEHLPG